MVDELLYIWSRGMFARFLLSGVDIEILHERLGRATTVHRAKMDQYLCL